MKVPEPRQSPSPWRTSHAIASATGGTASRVAYARSRHRPATGRWRSVFRRPRCEDGLRAENRGSRAARKRERAAAPPRTR